jgi:cytochrome c-type biogenesis protein
MNGAKSTLVFALFGLFAFIIFGFLWAVFFGTGSPQGFGWYLFSYAMGLTMIVLPCTLPLAFVIVPLAIGKGPGKGLGIALMFGIGVALTLSLYGLAASIVGKILGETAVTALNQPLENIKNWVYFIAGAFAYLFALGELGLINIRMPSYTGSAPAFIQKQQDYLKALFLGLFLGNIGVGCPHPATPLIFIEIVRAGDLFYGWTLFLAHAIGRIIPLLTLAALAILGVNALSWIVARKDLLERITGWSMVFVGAFILTLGLFTHDWWVYSGQHTLLEELTQEERFLGIIINTFGFRALPHAHGPASIAGKTGLFGLPLELGNLVLVFLWIIPIFWYYEKKKREVMSP